MIYKNGETADNSEILNAILSIRGKKVLTDLHLAKFFKTEVSEIRRLMRLHHGKFPLDYHFILTHSEVSYLMSKELISQELISTDGDIYAFTNNGVEVIAGLLGTDEALERYSEINHVFGLVTNMISSLEKLKDNLVNLKNKMTAIQEGLTKSTSSSRFPQSNSKYSDRFSINKFNY